MLYLVEWYVCMSLHLHVYTQTRSEWRIWRSWHRRVSWGIQWLFVFLSGEYRVWHTRLFIVYKNVACVCIHEDYQIIWVPLNHVVKSMKTHWYYYIFSSTVDHRLALSYKIPVGAFTYQYKKFLQVWKKSTSDMKSAYHTMLYCYMIMLCYKIMWSCMIMWCCIIIQIQIKGDSTPAGWWRSTVSTTLQ